MSQNEDNRNVEGFPSLADYVGRSERDIFDKTGRFRSYIRWVQGEGLHTFNRVIGSANDAHVLVWDETRQTERPMLMFASNNYLGLASHPKVKEAAIRAVQQYGLGVGGSPLICGTSKLHRELEVKMAAFEGHEDAILFASGYAANLGLVSALARPGDHVFVDRLVHASIIDGCAFSNAKITIFRHNDVNSLRRLLEKAEPEAGKLIVIEGVYSMDGDIAPLPQINALAREFGARVVIDEAHATGVIGPTGHGSVDYHGRQHRPEIVMGTLSKSLGASGGFVASSSDVIEYLRYFGRSHLFSAALTAPQVAGVLAALQVIDEEPWRVTQLQQNAEYLRTRLTSRGLIPIGSGTPIVPVMIGEELKALNVGRHLHENGVFANPILYPAVPQRRARIRLSVMSTHDRKDIDYLVDVLDEACRINDVPRYEPNAGAGRAAA